MVSPHMLAEIQGLERHVREIMAKPEVAAALKSCDNWQFDAFRLNKVSMSMSIIRISISISISVSISISISVSISIDAFRLNQVREGRARQRERD